MRRPNRNIEIFSLSVLDLFSAAMGAFIIIALILFPSFMKNKDLKTDLEGANGKLGQCLRDKAGLQGEISQGTQQLQKCLSESASTFVVVVMRWGESGYDVDLHVTDPDGWVYYYPEANRSHDGAELSFDNTVGPAVEIWQNPKAKPGNYCVAFHLFSYNPEHQPARVTVDGRVFFRNGATDIQPVTLDNTTNYYVRVGTIELTTDGRFSFQAGKWGCPEEPEAIRGASRVQAEGGSSKLPPMRR